MLDGYPVYTLENDCQDCCKCVRHCPVKAIGVEEGRARITPGLCIVCGKCVEVCPARVKTIRDDLEKVKELLSVPSRPVYVSLDPGWINAFPAITPSAMIASLKELGFRDVSETSLGAEQVAAEIAKGLSEQKPGLWISSLCPSVVEYIEKYNHRLVPYITPVISPLMAHCKLIRKYYGQRANIVHFGPCPASKLEADKYPDLLFASLTFSDLKRWFDLSGITLEKKIVPEEHSFVPEKSKEGGLYAIEGGLISDIKEYDSFPKVNFISLSGIDHVKNALEGLDPEDLPGSLFIECLACPGGCINGPCSNSSAPIISRRIEIEKHRPRPDIKTPPRPEVPLKETFQKRLSEKETVTEEQIQEALLKIGKRKPEDEINCGGCGYYTCRAFAEAMVKGMTEPEMCVSWMRKKAQKKSNALMKSMPSGVVIVDSELKIIECNQRFAELFGEDTLSIYRISPGLKGASLDRIIPFSDLFQKVLLTDRDIRLNHYRYGEKLFEIVIFSIEPNQTVGSVILDVTRRELRRDKIAHRANEVIQKNLSTVQEIACRLGEHMAETEILLRSIAEGYSEEESSPSSEGDPE